jgi:hypothetical protein
MIYPGLKDEQKTNDLVVFFKQFDADGRRSRLVRPAKSEGMELKMKRGGRIWQQT